MDVGHCQQGAVAKQNPTYTVLAVYSAGEKLRGCKIPGLVTKITKISTRRK